MHARALKSTASTLVLVVPLLAAIGLVGCGGGETLVPVEGEVKIDGKPLSKGAVVLYPDKAKGNESKSEPRGEIENGRFQIATHPHIGAPLGWYKVEVRSTEPSDPKNPYSIPRSLIPEKFNKQETSGLTLEVRKNAPTGTYDLNLK